MDSLGPLAESKVNLNPGIFAQPSKEAAKENPDKASIALFTIVFIHLHNVERVASDTRAIVFGFDVDQRYVGTWIQA